MGLLLTLREVQKKSLLENLSEFQTPKSIFDTLLEIRDKTKNPCRNNYRIVPERDDIEHARKLSKIHLR